MFKKLMAKIGIGSAKVDLVLHGNEYTLGDTVEGELVLQGGAVEQYINKVDVQFMLALRTKKSEHRQAMATIPFDCRFTLGAGERKAFPFMYRLPQDLLISSHAVAYYFTTNLDIAAGVDSQDKDYIRVNPPVRFTNIITAFEELGMREKHDSRAFDGYAQTFEFFPALFLQDSVREVEFIAAIEEEQVRLLLVLDMPSFSREMEVKREVVLSDELLVDVGRLRAYLQQMLEEMIGNPNAYLEQRHMMGAENGHQHRHSGFGGAMGGFAAGILGGLVLSELMDGMMGNTEETESAFNGGEEDGGGFGDFFGDMFGGGDE